MDWTTIGWVEPTFTPPTSTVTVLRRRMSAMLRKANCSELQARDVIEARHHRVNLPVGAVVGHAHRIVIWLGAGRKVPRGAQPTGSVLEHREAAINVGGAHEHAVQVGIDGDAFR